MDWGIHLDTAAACLALGALGGWFVPWLVARIPEPDPPPEGSAPKPTYADLAAAPGLAARSGTWAGLAAGLVGLGTGWTWSLGVLVPLVPVAVTLASIDFRARLLPTRLIAPSYAFAVTGILLVALVTRDVDPLIWAAIGWAGAGGLFGLLWLLSRGMGYGDVRLSGVLGLVLGHLGWGELLVGVYSGFVLGAVGWIPLRLLGVTTDRKLPFGPFMLVGALVGILWGDDLARLVAGQDAVTAPRA